MGRNTPCAFINRRWRLECAFGEKDRVENTSIKLRARAVSGYRRPIGKRKDGYECPHYHYAKEALS